MKVTAIEINTTDGKKFMLVRKEDNGYVAMYATAGHYWKTRKGAERWAGKTDMKL